MARNVSLHGLFHLIAARHEYKFAIAKSGMNDIQSPDPKSASEMVFFLASGGSRVFLHSSFPSPSPS
jgi:hypothetical protein